MMKKLLEEYWMNLIYAETLMESLNWCEKYRGHPAVETYREDQLSIYEGERTKCKKVIEMLDRIEDPIDQKIMYLRYVDRVKNSKIADITGYSETYVSRKIGRIVVMLEQMNITITGC